MHSISLGKRRFISWTKSLQRIETHRGIRELETDFGNQCFLIRIFLILENSGLESWLNLLKTLRLMMVIIDKKPSLESNAMLFPFKIYVILLSF